MRPDIAFRPAVDRGWRRWVRSALGVAGQSSPVRVVIYGEHSPDWMTALAPGAPVWKGMTGVDEVLHVPDAPSAQIPKPARRGTRTVVIPLMEGHTKRRPRQFLSLVPDDRALDMLANKASFADYAAANGLGALCPVTYPSRADAVFPCVLKRVDLHSGQGVAVVRSPLELETHLAEEPWAGQSAILQSLAPGDIEYVTHCVCKDGQILWHCSFAYSTASGAIRTPADLATIGPATASRSTLSQIERFLGPLAYCGPCNVDYRLSGSGDIVVFEINPRLGGSLMMPRHVDRLRDALSHIIDAALT